MHEKVISRNSRKLLTLLGKQPSPALKGWTLAGETGLALHLGHRTSEDFDFFRTDPMDLGGLHQTFKSLGAYETLQEAEHTLTVLLRETKLSFFSVAAPFLFPGAPYRFCRLADVRDIALTKLIAISGRGSRKDFVDLYTMLRTGAKLEKLFELLPRKYGPGRGNAYHILKSLTYFEEAEAEPMPAMLEPFDWKECKAFFVREAHAIVLA